MKSTVGKPYFNKAWLENVDSDNQLVHVWCVPKCDFIVTCRLFSTDMQYMGFAALKQHSEKQKHRALAGVDLSS